MSACKTGGPLLELGIALDATHKAVVERKQLRIVAIGSDGMMNAVRLARHGVFCIDALPGQVGVALVNRYLDIKRRELV